jgi:hypothetical protein
MRCPHCLTAFHDNREASKIGADLSSHWMLFKRVCPSCERLILSLFEQYDRYNQDSYHRTREILCYPKGISRMALSADVPTQFGEDYLEACLTLPDSAKASAALSRRCLQHLLRECAGVKPGDLAREIQQVMDSGKLPSHLSQSLDAIRNIGNFAAHPIKSNASGEIIEVEPGEAEWNLDVLESLFDFYFVQPALVKRKRDALNAKLKEAGKPEMK